MQLTRDEPLRTAKKLARETGITYRLPWILMQIFWIICLKKSGVTRNVIIDKAGQIVFKQDCLKEMNFDKMKEKIVTILSE